MRIFCIVIGVLKYFRFVAQPGLAPATFHTPGHSIYTSPNAPNVRMLNGHINISLGYVASTGMLGPWNFNVAVQHSDVRGVRAGVTALEIGLQISHVHI